MTENKAIDEIIKEVCSGCYGSDEEPHRCSTCGFKMAKESLAEIQQYRAIGTVEEIQNIKDQLLMVKDMCKDYYEIGTVEEFKALKEKAEPKKPIEREMPYSEEVGFNSEWYCPACGGYVGYCTEGMSEPEQMEHCNVCGQHIARDWSE